MVFTFQLVRTTNLCVVRYYRAVLQTVKLENLDWLVRLEPMERTAAEVAAMVATVLLVAVMPVELAEMAEQVEAISAEAMVALLLTDKTILEMQAHLDPVATAVAAVAVALVEMNVLQAMRELVQLAVALLVQQAVRVLVRADREILELMVLTE